MALQEVVSTVNLAHPGGGPPLPAYQPVLADTDDPFVSGHMDAGYIVPVTKQARGAATQTWDEHAAAIHTGSASDLGGAIQVRSGETLEQKAADQAREEAGTGKKG